MRHKMGEEQQQDPYVLALLTSGQLEPLTGGRESSKG